MMETLLRENYLPHLLKHSLAACAKQEEEVAIGSARTAALESVAILLQVDKKKKKKRHKTNKKETLFFKHAVQESSCLL